MYSTMLFSCISLVKAYGQQRYEARKFRDQSAKGAMLGYDIDKRGLLIYPIQESLTIALALMVVCMIAVLVVRDPSNNLSSLLVYLYLLKRCATAFTTVGDFRGNIATVEGLLEKISALLDYDDKFVVKSGQIPFSKLEDGIELEKAFF